MALIPMAVARRDGRDQLERGRSRRLRKTPLVAVEVSPKDHLEFVLEGPSQHLRQPLVAEQGPVERLVRDAVRDCGYRVEHVSAVDARVAPLVAVGQVEARGADAGT